MGEAAACTGRCVREVVGTQGLTRMCAAWARQLLARQGMGVGAGGAAACTGGPLAWQAWASWDQGLWRRSVGQRRAERWARGRTYEAWFRGSILATCLPCHHVCLMALPSDWRPLLLLCLQATSGTTCLTGEILCRLLALVWGQQAHAAYDGVGRSEGQGVEAIRALIAPSLPLAPGFLCLMAMPRSSHARTWTPST